MVFSSSVFLFGFFPIVLAVYYLVRIARKEFRNATLLILSLVFYAWGEPVYVALMVVSILTTWGMGRVIDAAGNRKKAYLILALAIHLAILGFFKYEGFVADNINLLFGYTIVPDLELPLPIGISFFTLQAITYLVDIYREKANPQGSLLNLGLYIAMFPPLIAGPIVRYETVEDQIKNREENLEDFASGLRLFAIGLAKKVLLADNVALLAKHMLETQPSDIGLIGAWGGIIAYSFQIFFDFAGYSDMAIGLGKMFGFKYLRNFNYPYIAKSITEFWQRWHISLSTFFRDYVYIPLGGNRLSKRRWVLNIVLVWGLTGLWHGAAWNFILWGLYYGVFLIIEKLFLGRVLEKLPRAVQHCYAILIFVCGWVFFWISDPAQIAGYFASMLGLHGLTGTMTFWELTVWEYWPIFVVCTLASTPVIPWLRGRIESYVAGQTGVVPAAAPVKGNEQPPTVSLSLLALKSSSHRGLVIIVGVVVDVALFALLVMSAFAIVSGSYSPFIYFQF